MNKLICLLIVVVFVFSGMGAGITVVGEVSNSSIINENIVISHLRISKVDKYVKVDFNEANSLLLLPGKPIIPFVKKTFILPFGSKIDDVNIVFSKVDEQKLSGKIKPAENTVTPLNANTVLNNCKEDIVYNSEEFYPTTWFTYDVGSGLNDGKHVVFLTVNFYPIRYSPLNNKIIYVSNGELKISYREPSNPSFLSNDDYDLLVIAPEDFTSDLEKFVNHKESVGVKTILVSLDDVYSERYFSVNGRDDAEKIKYFIKDAVEEWGIKYVLLVGGRKPGLSERWYFPVRYVNIFWADETSYVSDLYYADIYDGNGSFSTWDTDGNGVFGEWRRMGYLKDEMDLYPDVYVGRWACRSKIELKIMIKKTIDYENSIASNKVVLVGGDNFENEGIEGEIVCDKTLSYLHGFTGEKVYASEMDVTASAIRSSLGDGALFMHLHGHGSPVSWSTHKPDGFDKWEEGINVLDYPLFFNKGYSIGVFGGCHTAMFNVSMTIHPWGPESPEGLSWWFARKIGGGGIAALGYTCFPVASPGEEGDIDGDGVNDPDCAESGYGYMQLGIFKAYGVENKEYLGECWGYAENRYITVFKIPEERWHIHTIHGFILLGDPSLKIGGYSTKHGLKLELVDENNGILFGYPNVPVHLKASAFNGKQPYMYSWDLDEDGIYDDAMGETIEWTWSDTGVYWIGVKVVDAYGNEKIYNTLISIELKPGKIQGSSSGKPGVRYTYTAKATDDMRYDEIYYYFDWGDTNTVEIKGPYNSNNPITITHRWSETGTYSAKVKALLVDTEDGSLEETAWSDPLTISISKTRISEYNVLQGFLQWLFQWFSSAFKSNLI